MEVQKFSTTLTLPLRTVLVIEIRDTPHWPANIPEQEVQIKHHTDKAFAGSEVSRARYWICVIGPHWRYGFKDDDAQFPTKIFRIWLDSLHFYRLLLSFIIA